MLIVLDFLKRASVKLIQLMFYIHKIMCCFEERRILQQTIVKVIGYIPQMMNNEVNRGKITQLKKLKKE